MTRHRDEGHHDHQSYQNVHCSPPNVPNVRTRRHGAMSNDITTTNATTQCDKDRGTAYKWPIHSTYRHCFQFQQQTCRCHVRNDAVM
jgi:hypothetical protein